MARLLCAFTVVIAAVLILLVILAPLLDNAGVRPERGARLLALFARDATLRRTAIASAFGLFVTAGVFFRPSPPPSPPVVRKRKLTGPPPPPAGAAGA